MIALDDERSSVHALIVHQATWSRNVFIGPTPPPSSSLLRSHLRTVGGNLVISTVLLGPELADALQRVMYSPEKVLCDGHTEDADDQSRLVEIDIEVRSLSSIASS